MRRKKDSGLVNKVIVVVILVVFGGSLFAVTQMDDDEGVESLAGDAVLVSGYAFYDAGGYEGERGYVTAVERDGREVVAWSLTNPSDLGNVSFDFNAAKMMEGKSSVYFTYDPNELDTPDFSDVAYALDNVLGRQITLAFTEDASPPNPDVPLKDCEAVDYETAVVVFERGGVTEVFSEGGCVHVVGETEEDVRRAASKLALRLVGVEV